MKIDTPLMLTPLLSLGPGRLGIDLEAEALNNGICLRTGCAGERRGGRRRSIAELEARAEVSLSAGCGARHAGPCSPCGPDR